VDIEQQIRQTITQIPDFPKPGINFFDVSTLMRKPAVFQGITNTFAERYAAHQLDAIVGIDARGFIFGGALAYKLGVPFVPIRKPGKLPPEVEFINYTLEYGEGTLEIRKDALAPKDTVVVVDDLLATGGTAHGATKLVERVRAKVHECAFVIELGFLKGRKNIDPVKSFSLVTYEE